MQFQPRWVHIERACRHVQAPQDQAETIAGVLSLIPDLAPC